MLVSHKTGHIEPYFYIENRIKDILISLVVHRMVAVIRKIIRIYPHLSAQWLFLFHDVPGIACCTFAVNKALFN